MPRFTMLLRNWFALSLLLAAACVTRAQFTATYDFGLVTSSSGLTDPTAVPIAPNVTFGSFTAVGTPGNPNAGGRFSFTNWPTGGAASNDTYTAHTGSLDAGEYYQVTITPAAGYALNFSSLTFTVQRSGTGIRTYAVRSNAGGNAFATNLPASISPANANLSVQAGNIFYWTLDAQTGANSGSTVALTGPTFQNVTGSVTFRFYGWNAEAGTGTFSIDNVVFTGTAVAVGGGTPPAITTQPASHSVTEGAASTTFSVVASGTAPFTYQWRKGGSALANGPHYSGVATDTLTINSIVLSDTGNYDVVVSNGVLPNATSTPATLTVTPLASAPLITSQPTPQSATLGGSASFTVGATGSPAPTSYQWRRGGSPLGNGGNISGADTPTLTIDPVTGADFASYDVVVGNGVLPDATSNSAALSLAAVVAGGRVAYQGGGYAQNFDTLPASGTFTLGAEGPLAFTDPPINASGLGAWSLAKYDGSGAVALFRVDAGGGNSGSIYSYGSVSATDRALGSLSSGSTVSRFGVVLTNTTGRTITQFSLAYTGEQWRRGSLAANKLDFEYAVGGADINTGTFVGAPALDFTAPNTAGSSIALDGNLPGNRTAISATVTGLGWAAGQTLVLRWTDVDDTGSDDGLAIDDLSFSTPIAAGDVLPYVAQVVPAANTPNIAPNTAFSVTFSEAVNLSAGSYIITGSTSGVHTATISGGPAAYTLTPDAPFSELEDVTLTVVAGAVIDAATGTRFLETDYVAHFITSTSGPLPIHVIQGSGTASIYKGYPVVTQGIVVASFQSPGGIGGYYIEAPDVAHDGNPATSEGIYVFDSTHTPAVGDLITITGTIDEFGTAPASQTEVKTLTAYTLVSSGNALPTAVPVTLPFPASGYAERYEGMRVTFPQALTVTDNYDLGIFGEIVLSNGRLSNPTNIVAPGAPAQALAAANLLNQILVDDGLSVLAPSPTPYLNGVAPATATRRTGTTTTDVTGILDNRFGTYVVEPTAALTFDDNPNPRGNSPASLGTLRVVFGNVENLMNGDGAGGGFPTSRGASTAAEYQRQLAKVTAAILNLAPDVMGLSEVENDKETNSQSDSYGPLSAISQLVANLNLHAPAGTSYAFVNAAAVDIVTDDIHSAIIYRVETVETVGAAAMLDNPYFNNHARNPLAQTFRQKSTGAKFTFCVNHFRAKASESSQDDGTGLNNDQGDGQGTNNYIRVKEAQALTAWLATDPTGSGDARVLIVGDLNSYSKEDPITALTGAGYVNLAEQFEGEGGYSYAFNGEFGHLDHALASPSLATQVLSAATWHANSDEPVFYDYNLEAYVTSNPTTVHPKDATQEPINAGTPYRYSDHDPVVIGLNLTTPPAIVTQPQSQTTTVGSGVTFTVVATGNPAPTYQWRKGGSPIGGATSASYTIASPVTADAGNYDVVVTNSVDFIESSVAALTVAQAAADVALSNLTQVYDGSPKAASVLTTPSGLAVDVTYDGNPGAPANAGSYAVVATVNDADYFGSATGTLKITPATATVSLANLSQVFDGSPKPVTVSTTPSGLIADVTYNGSATAPTSVGTYAVVATINENNFTGTASGTLNITAASSTISLDDLVQNYDGTPKPVTVVTDPAGLSFSVTYNGSATPPTYPGAYAVVATVTDSNYTGSASDTLFITTGALVRHGPTVNGILTGSIQVLLPESVTLNSSAQITGDLLLPGTPTVKLNGSPVYNGTIDSNGTATPANHVVTLNSGAKLRHVVRRVNAIAMPPVSAPPAPAGTRNVTLNSAGQSPGDFATLRNLTLNSNAGAVAVPAGTYGAFAVNGSSSLVFGVAGSATPAVYNLQGLTLNGSSRITLVGPVIINLAGGVTLNGSVGAPGLPDWLELNVASGGVTLNGAVTLDGFVLAPNGTVTINGGTTLNGGVTADRLTINSGGRLNEE